METDPVIKKFSDDYVTWNNLRYKLHTEALRGENEIIWDLLTFFMLRHIAEITHARH